MGVSRRLRLTAGCVLGLGLATAAQATGPLDWIERMVRAVDTVNYEGTLVHMSGGESSVLSIAHRVADGHVTERVFAEDSGREIIRVDDEVTCILPDQDLVVVDTRDAGGDVQSPLRGHLPGPSGIDTTRYHVALAGRERILGHDAQGVAIRPKDGYRYGYRLWLDQATAMPLRTQLVDDEGTVLEQVLFTRISLPEELPAEAVRPAVPMASFAVRRATPPAPTAAPVPDGWAAGELPPGYRLVLRRAVAAEDAARGLSHAVYSDGLATVSLFVEPAVAAAEQVEGLTQVGAANAYTTVVDGHMVTAVGTVPARTVEMIASSARPGAAPSGP